MTFIVNETNRYAERESNKTILTRRSRYEDWKPTDAVEIKKSIGLLLHMGIVNLPRIGDYWSIDHFF